jgi:RHS repeat-associated protein
VKITRGSSVTTIAYGPDGARLTRTTNAGTSLTLGPDLERQPDGSWTKFITPEVKRQGLSTGTSASYSVLRDHLASVRLVMAQSDTVSRTSSFYGPTGSATKSTASAADSKGTIGERYDAESGLSYFNARYYDPVLGRFLSPDTVDPLLPGGGTSSGDLIVSALSPRLALPQPPSKERCLWQRQQTSATLSHNPKLPEAVQISAATVIGRDTVRARWPPLLTGMWISVCMRRE